MTCLLAVVLGAALPCVGEERAWRLIWSDEFNGPKIDSDKWSPCERGSSDWNDTMTRDSRCFKIGGGTLRLIGLANPDTAKDPSPFLTGGITSQGKFRFQHGKIEIHAVPDRLQKPE